MNASPSPVRLDHTALRNQDGTRIEFALHAGDRRICGFGILCISPNPDGTCSCWIRRLCSFSNGQFVEQRYPLRPQSVSLISYHRDPMVATLSLYEA